MKPVRRMAALGMVLVLGIVVLGLGYAYGPDSYWLGMGTGLVAASALRLVRICRFWKDESYRETVQIEVNDERNRYLRSKAWAWAGYLFLIISAISSIVLKVLGQELLSLAAGGALCLILVLYAASYLIVRKKY